MCSRPVTRKGGTCSLECYENFYQYLHTGGGYIPSWMPNPLPLEEHDWYAAKHKEMENNAESQEIDPAVLKSFRPLD